MPNTTIGIINAIGISSVTSHTEQIMTAWLELDAGMRALLENDAEMTAWLEKNQNIKGRL